VARFVKGDVVVVPFPYTNLSAAKNRPALVIATLPGPDILLCMITSQPTPDRDVIAITPNDISPPINRNSIIRPSRLFTMDAALVVKRAGTLNPTKLAQVTAMLIAMLQR